MAGQGLFGLLGLILTAGACLLTLFVILAGTQNVMPINDTYFLQADTSSIDGAPSITRWTLWNYCGVSDGVNSDCTKVRAANPFLPQQNFGTENGVPDDFINFRRTFFYLSRVMFAFYLISLFFMAISLLTGLLALCSRLGSAFSSFMASIALFAITLTAALMTSCFILGRNAFRKEELSAQVGMKAFAFTWASVACLFLAMVLYCLGFCAGRKHRERAVKPERTHAGGRRFPFFGRRRHEAY